MTLRSLFTAGALVTIGMLVGRGLGLLREMLLAFRFGIGHEADMAVLLLIIPDFVTSVLVGGGASATLIPAFAAREKEKALALLWQVLVVSVGLFIAIAFFIFIYEENNNLAIIDGHAVAFFFFLSSLPFTAATSIITAWLQYRGRFTMPAFATAIFNGVIILTLWLMPLGLAVLATGIFFATLLRLLAHVMAFYKAEGGIPVSWRKDWQLDKPLLKNYAATASSSIFSMFPQYAPYGILAAAGGGVAIFNYAFKLILMPAMLGQNVIQVVLLPWLVHQRGSASPSASSYAVTLQLTWILSLALCLSLSMASYDIVSLCFGHGKMTLADVGVVAHLFAIGVWALPQMLLGTLWQQIMFAHGKPRPPLASNALLALLVVPACLMGKAAMGLEGIAWMYVVIQIVPVVWLAYAACRLGIIPHYRPSFAYVRITLAMLAVWMPLAVWYHYIAMMAVVGVLFAVVAGLVTLAVGLYACPPVREWVWQRLIHVS